MNAFLEAKVNDGMFTSEYYVEVLNGTVHMYVDKSFVVDGKLEVVVVDQSDTLSYIRFPADPLNHPQGAIIATRLLHAC